MANGDFIPKWQLEHTVSSSNKDFNGHRDRIQFLEQEVMDITKDRDSHVDCQIKLEEKLFDLQNKLDTIKRIADYE